MLVNIFVDDMQTSYCKSNFIPDVKSLTMVLFCCGQTPYNSTWCAFTETT